MNNPDLGLNHLRAHGYRLTPQRLAILKALNQAGCHLTPAEIYQQVHDVMPGMTEATVYRTLNFLAEQGLVLVAHIWHGQLVYEMADLWFHSLVALADNDIRPEEIARELARRFGKQKPAAT